MAPGGTATTRQWFLYAPHFLLLFLLLLLLLLPSLSSVFVGAGNPVLVGSGDLACALKKDYTLRCFGSAAVSLELAPGARYISVDVAGDCLCGITAGEGYLQCSCASPDTQEDFLSGVPQGQFKAVDMLSILDPSSGAFIVMGCGVSFDGELVCWNVDKLGGVPVDVLVNNVLSVSLGYNDYKLHGCLIYTDFSFHCWGEAGEQPTAHDGNGWLSDGGGTRTTNLSTASLDGLRLAEIHMGECLACALTFPEHYLKCWWHAIQSCSNGFGLEGFDGVADLLSELPSDTVFSALSVSNQYGCAVVEATNMIKCFGLNESVSYGLNESVGAVQNAPITSMDSNVAFIRSWTQFSLDTGKRAYRHSISCALLVSSEILCWGDAPGFEIPRERWIRVAAGTNHVCALSEIGTYQCWTDTNDDRIVDLGPQLPIENSTSCTANKRMSPLLASPSAFGSAYQSSCGILNATRGAYCWSSLSDTSSQSEIKTVFTKDGPFRAVSFGIVSSPRKQFLLGWIICLLTDPAGTLDCSYNQSDVYPPPTSAGYLKVVVTPRNSIIICALQADATPVCWGNSYYFSPTPWNISSVLDFNLAGSNVIFCGQATPKLGSPSGLEIHCSPPIGFVRQTCDCAYHQPGFMEAVPSNEPLSDLALASFFACGIKSADGTLLCWGNDDQGQVSGAPVPTNGRFFVQVCANSQRVTSVDPDFLMPDYYGYGCAVDDIGTLSCWGHEAFSNPPRGPGFSDITCGEGVACAVTGSGAGAVCWGPGNPQEQSPGFGEILTHLYHPGNQYLVTSNTAVTVSENGIDSPLCGQAPYVPCATLSYAIQDAVQPSLPVASSVLLEGTGPIQVGQADGVMIQKDYVHLRGSGIKNVVIDCRNITACIRVIGKGIVLSNLTLSFGSPALQLDDSASVTVQSCSFINNTNADNDGGAVVANLFSTLKAVDTLFEDNRAGLRGGAIMLRFSAATFERCIFRQNVALDRGGAIFSVSAPGAQPLSNSDLVVQFSTFTANNASSAGGAIFAQEVEVSLLETSFNENHAEFGAALAFRDLGAVIMGGIFLKNYAVTKGGALDASNCRNLTIDGTNFTANRAGNGGGGALAFSLMQAMVNIHGTFFYDNQAQGGNGGAVSCSMMSDPLRVFGATVFSRNSAESSGPIFFGNQNTACSGRLDVSLGGKGGGMALSNCHLEAEDVLWERGHANFGGALAIFDSSSLDLRRQTFQNNKAWLAGGAVFSQPTGNLATGLTMVGTISETNFSSNTAICYGGGLFLTRGGTSWLLKDCRIVSNTASAGGGGIYSEGQAPEFEAVWDDDFNTEPNTACNTVSNVMTSPQKMSFFRLEEEPKDAATGALVWESAIVKPVRFLFEDAFNNTHCSDVLSDAQPFVEARAASGLNIFNGDNARLVANTTGTINGILELAFLQIERQRNKLGPHNINITVRIPLPVSNIDVSFSIPVDIVFRSCLPGSFWNDDARFCQPCEVGYISTENEELSCTPCSAGYYFDIFDATNASKCTPCLAGFYQLTQASTTCLACKPGRFTANSTGGRDGTQCAACPLGRFSSRSQTVACELCPAGQFAPVEGMLECDDCPANTVGTNGIGAASCAQCQGISVPSADKSTCVCPSGYFNPQTDSSGSNFTFESDIDCKPCPTGATCELIGSTLENLLSRPGYWREDNRSAFSLCIQPSLCPGGIVSMEQSGTPNRALEQCSSTRTGVMCTSCIEGHTEWAGECIPCDEPNTGIIIACLLLLGLATLGLHATSQTTSALPKVFFFFTQTTSLMTHNFSFLEFLSFTEFSPNPTRGCFAPLDSYQKTQLALAAPGIMLGWLSIFFLLRLLKWICTSKNGRGDFPINQFIRTGCAMYLFCFQIILLSCARYLRCVSVGHSQQYYLNIEYPDIDCDSVEYDKMKSTIVLVAVIFSLLMPTLIFVFLFLKRKKLRRRWFSSRWGAFFDAFRFESDESSSRRRIDSSSKSSSNGEDEVQQTTLCTFVPEKYQEYWRTGREVETYWYESIILFRRTTYIAVDTFTRTLVKKYSLYVVLSFLYLLVHEWLQPFNRATVNKLETGSFGLLIILGVILAIQEVSTEGFVDFIIFLFSGLPATIFFFYYLFTKGNVAYLKVLTLAQQQELEFQSRAESRIETDDSRPDSIDEYDGSGGVFEGNDRIAMPSPPSSPSPAGSPSTSTAQPPQSYVFPSAERVVPSPPQSPYEDIEMITLDSAGTQQQDARLSLA